MKWEDIVKQYPDKWVAVDDVVEKVVDGVTVIDTASLIAVCTTKEMNERISEIVKEHPEVSILSTGGTEDALEV